MRRSASSSATGRFRHRRANPSKRNIDHNFKVNTMPSRAPEAGITRSGESLDGVIWHILGQTYKPVQFCKTSFAFDTLFPPGTFVPHHVHPDQDEFIRVHEGEFDLWLDGSEFKAKAGDVVRMPMGSLHGIFNNSGKPTRALFWVTPSMKLYDLFEKLNNLPDPAEVIRVSKEYNIHFKSPSS
jgi:mannose-6-phosphate isomerase-like protein (cupin superfamily)